MGSGIDVVALGGNAIIPSGGAGTIAEQRALTEKTMGQVTDLIVSGRRVLLTHGNGPTVGNIVERNEAVKDRIPAMPLDICGADSQGGIGYMIQQILRNKLSEKGYDWQVASIVSQVVVLEDDDAFEKPTKPIGPFYTKEQAERLERDKGWRMKNGADRLYRRVVPSPTPREIVEAEVIVQLVELGVVVIAAGGGGIPVVRRGNRLIGVEAVVDKDRAASVLARNVGAERLIILTNVEEIYVHYGTPEQKPLRRVTLSEIRSLYRAYEFPAGSMGPKVRAAIDFLDDGGGEVIVSNALRLLDACEGITGTHIIPD